MHHNNIMRWLIVLLCLCLCYSGRVSAGQMMTVSQQDENIETQLSKRKELEALTLAYEEYQNRFASIEEYSDIESAGFHVIEDQVFQVVLESFGEGECTFVPALEDKYKRLGIFVVNEDGAVLFKTEQLTTNYRSIGVLEQPNEDIASVAFSDVNGDGLTDIILLTQCVNKTGAYKDKPYKIGDVLFQTEGNFYRDFRISDKINRFSMNKSANCIISYVRDGHSTEILYTATTLDELLNHGFSIIAEQCYARDFEKLGRLRVVPGTLKVAEYDFFMIYLVNDGGQIVWSFQPMEDYDNLYSLRGIKGCDLDGDGMKDLVVLARYSKEGEDKAVQIDTKCAIYYQRTGGFDIDRGFADYYEDYKETEALKQQDDKKDLKKEETMEEMVIRIREYWGWTITND